MSIIIVQRDGSSVRNDDSLSILFMQDAIKVIQDLPRKAVNTILCSYGWNNTDPLGSELGILRAKIVEIEEWANDFYDSKTGNFDFEGQAPDTSPMADALSMVNSDMETLMTEFDMRIEWNDGYIIYK